MLASPAVPRLTALPHCRCAAAVAPVGTVGTAVSPPPGDALPPAPPAAWAALQHDCQLVFNVEIRGRYIVPFTSPKGKVIARVLKDRYLRSALLPDISVGALGTFVVSLLFYSCGAGCGLGWGCAWGGGGGCRC